MSAKSSIALVVALVLAIAVLSKPTDKVHEAFVDVKKANDAAASKEAVELDAKFVQVVLQSLDDIVQKLPSQPKPMCSTLKTSHTKAVMADIPGYNALRQNLTEAATEMVNAIHANIKAKFCKDNAISDIAALKKDVQAMLAEINKKIK